MVHTLSLHKSIPPTGSKCPTVRNDGTGQNPAGTFTIHGYKRLQRRTNVQKWNAENAAVYPLTLHPVPPRPTDGRAAACTAVLPHHSLTMSNGKLHNVWGDKFIKPSIWPGAFILPAELPLRLLFWVVQPGPLEQIFLHFFFSSMLCFQTFSTVCVRMESIGASGKRRGIPSSITSVTLQLKLLMWVHAWNGCASEINFVLFASLHRTSNGFDAEVPFEK